MTRFIARSTRRIRTPWRTRGGAAGGGGVFPTISPTFDANDLVTVSIGGNDARVFQQGGGTVAAAPAAAAAAVANAEANLDVLVVAALLGFVSTVTVARFIERRGA